LPVCLLATYYKKTTDRTFIKILPERDRTDYIFVVMPPGSGSSKFLKDYSNLWIFIKILSYMYIWTRNSLVKFANSPNPESETGPG